MTIYIPYFYIIQDVRNGMYYAGAKWGKDANPETFMVEGGYTTSSTSINELIRRHSLDIFSIRKIKKFNTTEETRNYETRFLQKVDARNNTKFYNCHNNEGAMNHEKMKFVMMELYGVSIPLQNKNIKEKYKKTCNKKYGVDWILESSEIKKNGMIKKYGVDNYAKTDEWKEKTKNTCITKYDEDFYVLTDEFKMKTKLTCIKKYGVVHHTKTNEYRENVINEKKLKSQRPIVLELRKICKEKNIKLGKGWYQKSEKDLIEIKNNLISD
jgi:hypothetical protein